MDLELPHPPAAVWRALTDPDRMARWLMPNDFELEVGHEFTFRGKAISTVRFGGTVACEVLAFEPERMLRYSWRDAGNENGLDSVVTWRLHPESGGTRLTLEHRGFDLTDPHQALARKFMGGGWGAVLRRLADEVQEMEVRT